MPCPQNTKSVPTCLPIDWLPFLDKARGDKEVGAFIREAVRAAILNAIPRAKLSEGPKRGRPSRP